MRSVSLITAGVAGLAVCLAACQAPTSPTTIVNPSADDIRAHRAVWASHGLTNYSYTYEFSAFNAFADQPIRLQVRQDTVRAAVLVTTGKSLEPAYFPTVDALFDLALAAANRDSLRLVAFDPTLGYPVRLQIAANPDALSSVRASTLLSIW